ELQAEEQPDAVVRFVTIGCGLTGKTEHTPDLPSVIPHLGRPAGAAAVRRAAGSGICVKHAYEEPVFPTQVIQVVPQDATHLGTGGSTGAPSHRGHTVFIRDIARLDNAKKITGQWRSSE